MSFGRITNPGFSVGRSNLDENVMARVTPCISGSGDVRAGSAWFDALFPIGELHRSLGISRFLLSTPNSHTHTHAILVRPSEKLHLGVLSTQESAHNPSGCGRKWGAKDGKKEMSAGESKEDKVCGEASYMCTGRGMSLVPCAGRLFEHGLADTCFT